MTFTVGIGQLKSAHGASANTYQLMGSFFARMPPVVCAIGAASDYRWLYLYRMMALSQKSTVVDNRPYGCTEI